MTTFFKLRNVVVTAICLAATMMFLGCDKDPKEDNPGEEYLPGGNKTGWPPAEKLAIFTLGDWAQPAEMDDILWVETNTGGTKSLGIQFLTATATTANSINAYLEAWADDISYEYTGQNGIWEVVCVKYDDNFDYTVYYSINLQIGGSISIGKTPKNYSYNFQITGNCPFNPEIDNVAFYATKANPSSFMAYVSDANNANDISGGMNENYTVIWYPVPADGIYNLIAVKGNDDEPFNVKYYKAIGVSLINGGGSVDWSAFTEIPFM